jgi:NTE family protein
MALVLGAGGTTGISWLLGVMDALHAETGWEPARADVVSGTSAGAVAAAARCAGVPASRMLEMAEDRGALDAAIRAATGRAAGRRSLPLAWPGSLAMGWTGLLATDPRHRLASLAGFVPRGVKPSDEIRGLVHDATRDGWPTSTRLLVNACDYATGRRVTFEAGGQPSASLADAVVASAAVPGYYQPVSIGGRRYVDGGLVSFTNADVVLGHAPEVVLCLSPFSSARADDLLAPLRRAVAWQLRQEADRLRAAGAQVVVVEPEPEDLRAMGTKVMDRSRSRLVHETALRTTSARIRRLLDDVELPEDGDTATSLAA